MDKRKWTKEEIDEYRKTHGYLFYFNKEDSNFLVSKALGIGKTVNWANPLSWVLAVVFIAILVFNLSFK